MTALATAAGQWWAIVDGQTITHRDGDGPWDEVAAVPEPPATCLRSRRQPVGTRPVDLEAELVRRGITMV